VAALPGGAALPPAHPAVTGSAGTGGAGGGDLAAATAKLEARLAQSPGDESGWTLLAQSYEFQGRSADAAAARDHRLPAGAGTVRAGSGAGAMPAPTAVPALAALPLAEIAASFGGSAAPRGPAGGGGTPAPGTGGAGNAGAAGSGPPGAPASLEDLAERARRARDFPRAVEAFGKLAAQGRMSADLWADYADAVGAANGNLDRRSEPMIRKALALDPRHPKALWLLGSLQVEQHDYRSALASWQALLAALPKDSPDVRLVSANIGEAQAKLAEPATAAVRRAAP
jgi:cytochrome c-type biogenesis protein CcmH